MLDLFRKLGRASFPEFFTRIQIQTFDPTTPSCVRQTSEPPRRCDAPFKIERVCPYFSADSIDLYAEEWAVTNGISMRTAALVRV
jgi:hypothetical protein